MRCRLATGESAAPAGTEPYRAGRQQRAAGEASGGAGLSGGEPFDHLTCLLVPVLDGG